MRASIPLALLGAALVAGSATAQRPPSIAINAQVTADQGLVSRHDSPTITEIGTEPVGTVITTTPVGPKCNHWPAQGSGVDYWVVKDPSSFVYEGTEYIRAYAGDTGETGPHDNVIRMSASSCIPANVEVRIDSLLDSEHNHVWAEVEVVGYTTIYHDFVTEHTLATVPVMLDRLGLEVRVRTHLHVDNAAAPTFQGLVDLDIKITVMLPAGEYVTGGLGCAGNNGIPDLQAMAGQVPVVGAPFTVVTTDLPIGALPAFGMLAGSRLTPPLSLGIIGMPGCDLYVHTPVTWPLAKVAGVADWTISVPLDPSLVNAKFYQQVFALDASANALGAVVSNYGEGTIGLVPIFLP